MIEYIFFIGLVILFLKPIPSFMTLVGKSLLLLAVLYITCINPILGIAAAIIFIQILPVEGMKLPKQPASRLLLDESLRPKNSNQIKVSRPTKSPPEPSSVIQDVKPITTGKYTPF